MLSILMEYKRFKSSNSVINNNQIMIFLTIFDLKDVKRAMPRNFNENQFNNDCNHDF